MLKTLHSRPGRVGALLVVLLIGGVSVLILREPVAEAPAPAFGGGPPDPVRFKNMDGHARMVAVLGEIAANPLNPYFGGVILPPLRAKLANVASGSREEANFRYELGGHELRLGNTKVAIEQLEKAYNIVANFKGEVPPKIRREVTYQLAMAYMRLGEDQNCVNCHTSESCLFPIQGRGVHAKKEGSSKAIRYLEEILERDPKDASARWILNIAYMTLGNYPDGVPERHRIEPGTFDSEEEFPRFVDIAKRLALNTTSNSGGAIAEDFNNNDLLDIVVSNWAPDGQIRFFRNNGQGKFIDETEKAGLTGILGGLNLVQADYNNDGHTDVFVLRGAWLEGEAGRQPNSLLRNNGNGTFTDVTFDAGLAEDNHPTQTASWGDYDNDGQLDLFVGNEEGSSQLFHNNGNGTFTDLATRAGVTNNRFSKAVIWGDYNGDSHTDLYVSNLGQPNRLYRNNADGTFTDIAGRLGVDLPRASFPAWFWDFDNDGNLDLFVSGYEIRDGIGNLAKSFLNMPHGAELARLYRGNGKGGFDEVSQQKNLKKLTMPMGANFGDLDNDGFLDFYLGTGYTDYEALMPNVMYHNRRGKSFADVTTAGGFGHLQKGHGVLFADLDNDGDQDVFEQIGGAFPGDVFGDVLFQNPGFGNHWIKLKLIGVQSNRSAIGARIKIQITEDGKQRSIYRHVNSGGSFGANSLRQDIGLGRATTIDTLEIHWPTSGLTQILYNIGVDSFLEITEKGKKVLKLPLPKIKF